jgi:hypothetical protein
MMAKCDIKRRPTERIKQKETWKEIRYRKWKWLDRILRQDNESIAKKALEWNLRGKKGRTTQNYMAKHSEGGSTASRKELARNKISDQKQDPMASFHKGPMPL